MNRFILIFMFFLNCNTFHDTYILPATRTHQFPLSWDQPPVVVEPQRRVESVPLPEPIAQVPAGQGRRVALVIGNSAYIHVPRLKNAANDAKAVASKLQAMGFDVEEAIDCGRRDAERAMQSFLHKAQNAELALFLYAGHGLQVKDENYLIPIDAKLEQLTDLEFEAVNVRQWISLIQSAAKVGLVFLDACRNNPFRNRLHAADRSVTRGLASILIQDGDMLIAYATSPGEVASDGNGNHSPFTAALLRYMDKPDVEIQTMLKRVTNEVDRQTKGRQRPWQSASLRSDVYLAPTSASP